MAFDDPLSLTQPHVSPDLPFLSGWKDIATYLSKGVRTVQRYERELRLPVRRPAGKARGSVIVSRRELDEWVSASSMKSQPRPGWNAQAIDELKSGVSEWRRLCSEGRQLSATLRERRTALQTNLERIGRALSGMDVVKAELHRSVAAEQKARAIEMMESVRKMTDSAIQMRKLPRRHVDD